MLDTATATRPTGAGRPAARSVARVARAGPGATVAVLAAWAALLVVANRVGEVLLHRGYRLLLHVPPIVGRWDWRPGPRALLAVGVGGALVVVGPGAARRLSSRALPWATAGAAVAWSVALALVDGVSRLTSPVSLPGHYLGDVARVGAPHHFLSTFVADIGRYGTHVRGHPPGFVLLLWVLDRVGLGGAGWETVLALAGGGAAVAGVLVTVREVAGDDLARRAAPFLALAPLALWIATTEDAFFAGVGAWAVALVVLATGARGRRADGLALGGGLLLGATAMLSYGLVLLAAPALVVAVARRRLRPVLLAAAAAALVVLAFVPAGFWYGSGLVATRHQYLIGVAGSRPYWYFVWADLAVLALAVGPAVVVGLVRLRDPSLWLVVGGALLAVLLADLSGMSKAEVERIWLPFAVFVLPAAAVLAPRSRPRAARGWLAAQAGLALLVQVSVRTLW